MLRACWIPKKMASAIPITRKANTTLGEITCAILSTPPTLVLKANPTAASKPNPLLEPVRRTFTTSLPQPAKDKIIPIPAANPMKKKCMLSRASVEKVTTCRTWNKCDQFHKLNCSDQLCNLIRCGEFVMLGMSLLFQLEDHRTDT